MAVVKLKNNKKRVSAEQVVLDNGGKISGSWSNSNEVIYYKGEKYKFHHPIWDKDGNVQLSKSNKMATKKKARKAPTAAQKAARAKFAARAKKAAALVKSGKAKNMKSAWKKI